MVLQVAFDTIGTVALRNVYDTAPPELVVPHPLTIALTPAAYNAVSVLAANVIGATALLIVAGVVKCNNAIS